MKRKLKIIARFAKTALVKVSHLTHENFYRGYSAPEAFTRAVTYPFRYGPVATIARAKRELLRIGTKSNVKHLFPNGLVSGIDKKDIRPWYDAEARRVSIVIPSYNDLEVLRPAVESIHATCDRKDHYEVIIVDDYCEPDNAERLKELIDDNTRIIFRKKNGGFAKAVNTGLKEVPATHDAILFNSDVVAHAGWLEALQYGAYEFGEDVGVVAPKLLYGDGRIQSGGSYRNTENTEWFDHYYRFQAADYGPANVPNYVQSATGAVLYLTRNFINKVGMLDDKFAFAFEDADLCLRGWEAGFRTLYFPAAVLTHLESVARAKRKNISDSEKASVVYFWKKWGDWYDRRNVRDENGKIRIIYVLQTVGWSGGIRVVFEHANRLQKLGFNVEVWSLSNKPVWPLDVPLRSFRNYDQLTAELEPIEAIKVATWWETIHPVWMSSVRNGVGVNFLQEIETWFYPDDFDAQRVVVSCYRKDLKNLTTSSYNLEEIRSFGLNATLIPCGYDDKVFYPLKDSTRRDDVLLGVGRSFFQKNFMFSLRAWKRLAEKRPKFWLYGSEPDMKALDGRITYFNRPTDQELNKLQNEATAFVQTSYHEGFCLPIIEAMSTGATVICTDAHGNRDFCQDGKNCVMVEQDNEEQLQATIKKVFADPKFRSRLGEEAKKTAEDYTWDNVMKKLVTFYEDLAAPAPIIERVEKKYGTKKGSS